MPDGGAFIRIQHGTADEITAETAALHEKGDWMTECANKTAAELNDRLLKVEGEVLVLRQVMALLAIALDAMGSLDKGIFNTAISATLQAIPDEAADRSSVRLYTAMREALDDLKVGPEARKTFLTIIDGGKK